jgi:hypothetical protein
VSASISRRFLALLRTGFELHLQRDRKTGFPTDQR